mgnify:CR=1 FL=1
MPDQNKKIISKYQGDKNPDKRYLKLGRKITDVVAHKIGGVTSDDPEYWGLREVLTPEMCDVANKMKLRKHYTFEQLLAMNKEYEAIDLQKLLDEMSYIAFSNMTTVIITTTITSLKTVRESDVTAYPFTYPVRPSFSTLPLTE